MIIPVNEIPLDTLMRIAEEYVAREGTDYGTYEYSLEQKVQQLIEQIRQGSVLITFDEATESVNLLSAQEYRDTQKQKHSEGACDSGGE